MHSPVLNDSRLVSTSALAPQEDCSEESIYAPGYIQPHGLLLVLHPASLKILQVSDNVESYLGRGPSDLLGKSLRQVLPRSQVQKIVAVLDAKPGENPTFELRLRPPGSQSSPQRRQSYHSRIYRTEAGLLLEMQPQTAAMASDPSLFYHRLQTTLLHLRSASGVSELAQALAQTVKRLTGFDRVMVYRFEMDDHGVVIAEVREPQVESFLGLHFPAFDIPIPARHLFYRHWIRTIPDVNTAGATLVPTSNPLTEEPLDLSATELRGPSPYHVEYLQNMGVAGSMTLSLVDGHRLWGLIACHHSQPKLLDYETRKSCEFLGQLASIELLHQQEKDLSSYRMQVKAIQDNLHQALLQNPSSIEQVLTHSAAQLLDLIKAEGVAIVLDQTVSLVGQTPTLDQVKALLTWLEAEGHSQREIYLTDSLAQAYPASRPFKDVASGVLVVSIALHERSYHLVWFRPEQIQTVNWAGAPASAIRINPAGEQYLTPRKSFALWQETVQDMSLPWTSAESEAALMMRNTLMLAVLEFSQVALAEAAERAAIANRAKSQFLAKMSHELRTPLNAILGFSQVMARSHNTPLEFQEPLGIISRSGEHLLTLINDVLEMSKIEAGQLTLSEKCFDLFRLVDSVLEMFALKATGKGIHLKLTLDQAVPQYVCGDEAKLRQILINLLSNAVKFTTQGEVQLSLHLSPDSLPQPTLRRLHLEVKDTGCGIAPADLGSIFEAFVQAEPGRNDCGTGLGLAISRQFAHLMGGDITVHSVPESGSTFTCTALITLPTSSEVVVVTPLHPVVGLAADQPPCRILIAEDVPENRQLLITLLTSVGFEVKTAVDGLDAIALWQSWQPHLILMDIQMPKLDGHAATRRIRQLEQQRCPLDPGLDHGPTPIIALTAYAFEADRTASLLAGCSDYIAKPFTEAELFETLAVHLGIQYRYAEPAPTTTLSTQPLSRTDLAELAPTWISQVHEAALDLNDAHLQKLIAQIRPQKPWLADKLTHLVNDFQLEEVARLTQVKDA